jgi:hypothetical protein
MQTYVKFPQYKNYSEFLQLGFKSYEPKTVSGKKILVILDVTGSMDGLINGENEGTKITFAKKIIENIIDGYPFSEVDIMPFSDFPKQIVSFKEIPEPRGCTYFTPILPEVTKYVKTDSDYSSVIFMSDGLPSESLEQGQRAISALGSYCREAGSNTIAVAIGSDADGKACSLFTGNRGYNCFGKFHKEIPEIMNDVLNGIKCNYVQVSEGIWIPVEESGNYYYLSDNFNGSQMLPNINLVRKYINLIIQNEINDSDNFDPESLIKYIKHVAELLSDKAEQEEVVSFFTKSLHVVRNTIDMYGATPSIASAVQQTYRSYSSPVTGI